MRGLGKSMISSSPYFFLSEDKVLVSGAKNSVILDLQNGKIHRVNTPARRIIEHGEHGLKIGEAIERLTDIEKSDICSFLEDAATQGLIKISPSPKELCTEKVPPPELNFLWIEVTSRCNLRCIHCYAEAGPSEADRPVDLPEEDIKRVIDEAAAIGCQNLQFTGGEPVLRDDLRELIEYAKAKGFKFIEIFTNGTLLTESLIQFLAEERINVAMSIYSYEHRTHDNITCVSGSFERTINSLKLLLAYEVPVRCAVIAMKQNEDELDGTSYFLSRLGVLCRFPDPIRPTGRGKSEENWPQKYGLYSMQTRPNFFANKGTYEIKHRWNSCWYGKAAVTGHGDVLPCIFARDQVAGNIKQQNLSEILKGEKMLHFWGLTRDHIETCRDCEYRYVCEDCRPLAYGFAGNLYAKSPRCTYNPYTGEWTKVSEALQATGECTGMPHRNDSCYL